MDDVVVGDGMSGSVGVVEDVGKPGLIKVGVSESKLTTVGDWLGVSEKVGVTVAGTVGILRIGVRLSMVGGREGVTTLAFGASVTVSMD